MKYCTKCGKELIDEAVVCTSCGCSTGTGSVARPTTGEDAPSAGLAVLSFFIPLVGLILYLIYKDTFPLRAKSVGKGALIGFIVGVVVTIVYVLLFAVIFGEIFDTYSYYYY